jgi:hypothetical protein
VLQDHPEFQYAPSKKKGPKGGQKDDKQSVCDSLKSQTVTPVQSPRSTPAQSQLPAPTPTSKNLAQNLFNLASFPFFRYSTAAESHVFTLPK